MKRHSTRWQELHSKLQLESYSVDDVIEASPFSEEALWSTSKARELQDWKNLLGTIAFMQKDSLVTSARMLNIHHASIIHRSNEVVKAFDQFNKDLFRVIEYFLNYVKSQPHIPRYEEAGMNEFVAMQLLENNLSNQINL